MLGQAVEKSTRPVEIGFVRLVEADHHLVEVRNAGDLFDHRPEGRPVHLGGQTGDDERHGTLGRPGGELGLEVGGRAVAEVVEGGDDAVLEEIGHGNRLGAPGPWPDVRNGVGIS